MECKQWKEETTESVKSAELVYAEQGDRRCIVHGGKEGKVWQGKREVMCLVNLKKVFYRVRKKGVDEDVNAILCRPGSCKRLKLK